MPQLLLKFLLLEQKVVHGPQLGHHVDAHQVRLVDLLENFAQVLFRRLVLHVAFRYGLHHQGELRSVDLLLFAFVGLALLHNLVNFLFEDPDEAKDEQHIEE